MTILRMITLGIVLTVSLWTGSGRAQDPDKSADAAALKSVNDGVASLRSLAEAERLRRAKVIDAEDESQAAEKFLKVGQILSATREAMHLRYLTTLQTTASDRSNTIVFPLPLDLLPGNTGKAE